MMILGESLRFQRPPEPRGIKDPLVRVQKLFREFLLPLGGGARRDSDGGSFYHTKAELQQDQPAPCAILWFGYFSTALQLSYCHPETLDDNN